MEVRQLGDKYFNFDLVGFSTKDSEDGRYFEGFAIFDEDGNFNKNVARDFDLMRKTLADAIQKEDGDLEKALESINQENGDLKAFPETYKKLKDGKAKLVVFANNYDADRDANFEINSEKYREERAKKKDLSYRLALIVENEEGDHDILTLGDIYGTYTGDTKFNEAKTKIEKEVKRNGYFIGYITPKDVSSYGTMTRLNVQSDASRAYSLKRLKESNQYINVSDPYIYSGSLEYRSDLIDQEFDPSDPEAVKKADAIKANIEEAFEKYKLAGRPVVFVTQDPSLQNATSSELASIFFDQLRNKADHANDPSVKLKRSRVTMICLDSKKLTVSDFFSKFASTLNAVKSATTKEEKQKAGKAFGTISHRYTAFNVLRELARYKRHIDTYIDWDARRNNNNKGIPLDYLRQDILGDVKGLSQDEIEKKLKRVKSDSKTIYAILDAVKQNYNIGVEWIGQKKDHDIVLYKDIKNEKGLIVDAIVDQEFLANTDFSKDEKGTRQYYYDKVRDFLNNGEDTFEISHVLVTISDFFNKANDKDGRHYNQRAVINALTGDAEIGYEPRLFKPDSTGAAIEYHAVYDISKKNENRRTDFVEKAFTPEDQDIFGIAKVIVTGQNLLVDFNAVKTEEEINKDDEIKKQELENKLKIERDKLTKLGLDDMIGNVSETKTATQIVEDFKKTPRYNSDFLSNYKMLVKQDNGEFKVVTIKGQNEPNASIEINGNTIKVTTDEHVYTYENEKLIKTETVAPKKHFDETVTDLQKYNDDVKKFLTTNKGMVENPDLAAQVSVLLNSTDFLGFDDVTKILNQCDNKTQSTILKLLNRVLEINNC
jgi:hypothetical protein